MRAIVLCVALAACGGASGSHPARPVQSPTGGSKPTTPTPGPAATAELTGSVKKVRVEGVGGSLQDQVVTALASTIGKSLDPDRLRALLVDVSNLPGVADVSVDGVQLADGIELVVAVSPQPTIRRLTAVEVGGNPIALGIAAIPDGTVLDPKRLQTLIGSLRDRYVTSGHFGVEVAWRRVDAGAGIDVVIEVTPGPASTIASIKFEGNTIASTVLAAQIDKLLVVGEPVVVHKIELAGQALAAFYWDRGYANVKVISPEPASGPNTLVFKVEQGPVFRMGTITITGVPKAEHAKHLKAFGVKKGDVFNRTAIAKGRQRIVDALAAIGKPDAIVLPLSKVDISKRTIDLTLEISGGGP